MTEPEKIPTEIAVPAVRERVELPKYKLGEERFNWITHCVGAGLSVIALILAVIFSALSGNVYKIVSSAVYGVTMILLYTISTLYHALPLGKAKKVFRVFDHCVIFMLIAGTYTPYTLVTLRAATTWVGWTMFGVVWGAAIIGIILNAVNLHKFRYISMACYIIMGWMALFSIKTLFINLSIGGFLLMLFGGVAYTVGAVIYGLGKKIKKPYVHSVWHIFVIIGSILQFFSILMYVI